MRFKLLALVPPISALALVAIASGTGPFKEADDWLRSTAAFAGFIVTVGVRIYDLRNSELHDDLISRGRRLEHQLGISSGLYTQRRTSTWPIQHDLALFLVYGVVLLAWLAASVGWFVHALLAVA